MLVVSDNIKIIYLHNYSIVEVNTNEGNMIFKVTDKFSTSCSRCSSSRWINGVLKCYISVYNDISMNETLCVYLSNIMNKESPVNVSIKTLSMTDISLFLSLFLIKKLDV